MRVKEIISLSWVHDLQETAALQIKLPFKYAELATARELLIKE